MPDVLVIGAGIGGLSAAISLAAAGKSVKVLEAAAEVGGKAGTVIVEPQPTFAPGPGLRTVRVHPLDRLERLAATFEPWRDRLQGAALAGERAWALEPALVALGVSRLAPPGRLQQTPADWSNAGVDWVERLGEGSG